MPLTNKTGHDHNSANKKAAISNIMKDAPLFAGLDDFVLPETVKKNAETLPTGTLKENKKTVTRQKEQVNTIESVPRPAAKAKKVIATESSSILLSVTEICALLKISRATLIRMDKAGKLPGRIKLGGSVRFHRETIENWLLSLITIHPPPKPKVCK